MKITELLSVGALTLWSISLPAQPKLNTKPLTLEGDIASHLVEGVDKFLLNELAASLNKRDNYCFFRIDI